MDWSDWAQKYPLKFAANEDFDLIYAANWAGYNDQAIQGGFMELTDEMLQKYAPMTWEAMPEVSREGEGSYSIHTRDRRLEAAQFRSGADEAAERMEYA